MPQFDEEEVDGVTVLLGAALARGRLSPTRLTTTGSLISTSPEGVAQARAGDDRLADSEAYERSIDQLPDEVSALVFLNLDELFGPDRSIGLAEDPDFAELTVLFENASSVGLAVNGEDDRIRTELFLDVD